MAKFITAKEAAQLIPDHATVGVAGMGLSGWPEEIACAIRDNFAETGHPCDLNLKQASALGDWGYGLRPTACRRVLSLTFGENVQPAGRALLPRLALVLL